MTYRSRLKANIFYNILYQLLLIITPLITAPYVSRVIGVKGVGVYSYTYSLASCFAMVGLLGVANYGNRMIASVQQDMEKRSRYFWSIFFVQAIFSIVTLSVYLLYIAYICKSELKIAMIIQTLTVICSLFDINWYFFGVEKFKLTVTRNTIIKVLNVALIFLLVKNPSDTNKYVLIITASLLLSNIVIWPFLKKEVVFIRPTINDMAEHIKPLMVLFIPIIAITLYNRMDKVMIGVLSSIDQTGFFENTEKIINVPKSFITAIGTVMLPRMTNLYATGEKQLAKNYIDKTMHITCLTAVAMSFGIAAIANEFAVWFFGEEFTEVGKLMIVISPTIFFVSWANVIRTQYLIPLKKDKVYVISVWLGAVSNLIANFLLIPQYGAMGAIIGTVLAELVVMAYQSYCVKDELPIVSYFIDSTYYIAVGLLMYFIIRMISRFGNGGLVTILLELSVGGGLYIILGGAIYLRKNRIGLQEIGKLFRR